MTPTCAGGTTRDLFTFQKKNCGSSKAPPEGFHSSLWCFPWNLGFPAQERQQFPVLWHRGGEINGINPSKSPLVQFHAQEGWDWMILIFQFQSKSFIRFQKLDPLCSKPNSTSQSSPKNYRDLSKALLVIKDFSWGWAWWELWGINQCKSRIFSFQEWGEKEGKFIGS